MNEDKRPARKEVTIPMLMEKTKKGEPIVQLSGVRLRDCEHRRPRPH
jgi:hypothetical protein